MLDRIVSPISINELVGMDEHLFDGMIKAVVDVNEGILMVNADLHADMEKELLSSGSLQENLWGINLYPEMEGEDFVEFDSLINIRPWQGNRNRDVNDSVVRDKIYELINKLILR